MPDIPTLTISDASGTERATLNGIETSRSQHVTDRNRARFVVDREEWQSVASAINRRADRFRIDADGETGWFGGRFRDTERGSQTVTVILDDYERDARDAEPTGGQVLFENVDDATVVQDALSRIPTLSPGTIETVATGVSFSFANAEPAKMIRDAAEPGGALVRYNPDRTVDFVERPATGSEPDLSTAAGTLVGEPNVSDDNRNPPTEIIGLGAQAGPNQVRATATVDPTATRDVYRRYENKDIQQQSRLQTVVDRLANEVAAAPDKLDVETEAVMLSVAPGDPVAFVWPAEDINATLRVIEYTETVTQRGRRYAPLRVSNRWPEQGGSDKAIADLERFNRGYQGFIDRDNFRAVERQPVTAATNATGEYPYPDDVLREDTAEITVRSIPYRAYSSGAEDNSDFTNITDQSSGLVNATVSDTQLTTLASFTIPNSPPVSAVYAGIDITEDPLSSDPADSFEKLILYDKTDGIAYPPETFVEFNLFNGATLTQTVQKDVSGHEFEFQARGGTGGGGDIVLTFWYQTSGKHTHPPEPGLIDSFPNNPDANPSGELLASGVDVIINGSTVATDIGSGQFTATVDISGEFAPGVNDIEVTSDSLGLVSAYVQTELFRQGGEQP